MRYSKFFSVLVFTILLGYGAVGFYFLPMTNFQGDLTRLGMLPEQLFGWHKAQPAVEQQWLRQASLQEADVLVIGDSFSDNPGFHSWVWQSVLMKHGLKVRTESWESIRRICADFVPWLRGQGFIGKYLVIESIERNLVDDLSNSVACQHTQFHPNIKTDQPRYPPILSFDTNRSDYSGKLSISIRTQLNLIKYKYLSRRADFKTLMLPNEVKVERVANGCDLFSHARCKDALFLSYDKSAEIDDSALKNIDYLNSRLTGIMPIWVVVPNKSTAYLYPDKQFWNMAEQRFHAPDLLRMTQQAIKRKVVDLYPANNTHFSTTGYLLMGEEIFKTLKQAQPLDHLR